MINNKLLNQPTALINEKILIYILPQTPFRKLRTTPRGLGRLGMLGQACLHIDFPVIILEKNEEGAFIMLYYAI